MRFMMIVKANPESEAGQMPRREEIEAMGKYNDELIKAGVLLDGAGLQPTSKGAKVTFPNGKPQVTDGPFAETKEVIAGYWMIQVNSKEEAIAWASRVPVKQLPGSDRVPEIELRQMFEITDFPDVPASVAEMEASFSSNRAAQSK